MEMREALVDVVYLELKAQGFKSYPDVDYQGPTHRSRYDDVLAWLQRNRVMLFSDRAMGMALGNPYELPFVCGETALEHALSKPEALSIIICAELAQSTFLQQYEFHDNPFELLVSKISERSDEYLLPALIRDLLRPEENIKALDALIGAPWQHHMQRALRRFGEALGDLVEQNNLRLKADEIVADKFQVGFQEAQYFFHHTSHEVPPPTFWRCWKCGVGCAVVLGGGVHTDSAASCRHCRHVVDVTIVRKAHFGPLSKKCLISPICPCTGGRQLAT